MIRKLFMALAALAAASCATPARATETPSTATFIGIDGRPLVFHDASLQRMCNHRERIERIAVADLPRWPLPDGSLDLIVLKGFCEGCL